MKCPEIQENASKTSASNRSNMLNVDFSEYLWMGEELEEFDRKVEEEFWEEEFIEACFEQMLAEEETTQSQWYIQPDPNLVNSATYGQNGLTESFQHLALHMQSQNQSQAVQQSPSFKSKLNPEAPEFVPSSLQQDR